MPCGSCKPRLVALEEPDRRLLLGRALAIDDDGAVVLLGHEQLAVHLVDDDAERAVRRCHLADRARRRPTSPA